MQARWKTVDMDMDIAYLHKLTHSMRDFLSLAVAGVFGANAGC